MLQVALKCNYEEGTSSPKDDHTYRGLENKLVTLDGWG